MNTVLSDFVRGPIFKSIMETQYGNVYKPAPRIDIPTGGIVQYGGVSAPTSWLFCDGAAVERSTYADLFAALGGLSSPYGMGNNISTFNVPDLRGRVPMGAGTGAGGGLSSTGRPTLGQGLTPRALGAYDGDERLHAHLHPITDVNHNHTIIDPGHEHRSGTTINGDWVGLPTGYGEGGWATGDNPPYNNNISHIYASSNTTGITNQQSLSGITTTTNNSQGGLRGNVQPSVVLNYLIRT